MASCSKEEETQRPPDMPVAVADLAVDQMYIPPDLKRIDDPFGRTCTEPGQPCKDPDPLGYELICIALEGGTEGVGFCTRTCTDVGNECFGAANGQWAACVIGDEQSTRYCAFLCKNKELTWSCPPQQACGEPNENEVAICLP